MRFATLASTSRAVAATRSRLEKVGLVAECLRRLPASEIEIGVCYLSGELPQGKIGLGPAIVHLARAQEASDNAVHELNDIDAALGGIAATRGKGAQAERQKLLSRLFADLTTAEQDFLTRLVLGELRQGALEGIMLDAIADAAGLPPSSVRRASMLAGELAPVALAALTKGTAGLDRFRLQPLHPIRPMLAQPTENLPAALEALGSVALEYKLDGARVQVHKSGREVRVFSRGLNDVTARTPELVEAVRALSAAELIIDGEVLALGTDGRPQPFQITMRRFGRKLGVDAMRAGLPLAAFYFDCLHLDGEDLIDRPAQLRFDVLGEALPTAVLVPRRVTDLTADAERFLQEALAAGHEGIMAKSLDAPYEAGSRGSSWLKVKPAQTLDLVVLAAEWGSGRRQGRLSNLHLGARDPEHSGFVMLGKTFKGLTDRVLAWQTQALLEREIGRAGYVVHVRPELVVEVAFNDLQASPHYPAGIALRFARVKRYRPDKTAAQADTIDTVRDMYHERLAPRLQDG